MGSEVAREEAGRALCPHFLVVGKIVRMRIILHNENQRPDVLVHVAANVRSLRLAAELSQQALADQAEISRRMLVNIEKGDVNVSLGTLDKLAEALGVLFYALVQPPESEDSARIIEVAGSQGETAAVGGRESGRSGRSGRRAVSGGSVQRGQEQSAEAIEETT